MKRIFASLLAAILLASTLAVGVSAEQTNVDADVLKFTAKPTFDGVVSVEEWGEPTVTVKASEAATKEDNQQPSPFNTYAEFETDEMIAAAKYDLWLRWDSEYFFIAARVTDPDGYSLPSGGANIWNGDCLQTRIDPDGPSSGMLTKYPDFNYKTDAFDYKKLAGKTELTWKSADKIINAGFGLVGGFTLQAFDMQSEKAMDTTLFSMTTTPNDPTGMSDDFGCENVYEIAIPWATIGGDGYAPNENDILGMTVVVINGAGSGYNGLLTWGSGITGGQNKDARKTLGGSNAVHLLGTEVTPKEGYAVATEQVTEEAPEDTLAPAQTQASESKDTAKAGEETKKNSDKVDMSNVDNDGLPTWAIGAIIAAAVVVIVVVVVIVTKKKGGKKE